MNMSEFSFTRRGAILAAMAAGGCAATPSPAALSDTALEGQAIYSESVQMSGATPDGSVIFSIRLCQYPEAGVAWIWASLLTPDGSYVFANNAIPWSGDPSFEAGANAATYAARYAGVDIRFQREGQHGKITSGVLEFSRSGPEGFSVKAEFRPSSGFVGLLADRSEMFGHVTADVAAGGNTYALSGEGQWHEQPQTDPRFVIPFVYASLWGTAYSGTLLQSPKGSGGYLLKAGASPTIFNTVEFAPISADRLLKLGRADGPPIETRLELLHAYSLQIYGKTWHGTFVQGELFGEHVVGFVNNWLM